MDYLFSKVVTNIPEQFEISCYYIIDNHLKFISLYQNKYFYFHYVDSYKVGELIQKSQNEYEFDVYVLKTSKPIISQKSEIEVVNKKESRVVTVRTYSGNPLEKKKKQKEEKTVITRYQSNGKKLF